MAAVDLWIQLFEGLTCVFKSNVRSWYSLLKISFKLLRSETISSKLPLPANPNEKVGNEYLEQKTAPGIASKALEALVAFKSY